MKPLSLAVESLSVHYERRNLYPNNFGSFRRPKQHLVQALNQISFLANEGDIIGVMGANGAGKSTLFNALSNRVSYHGNIHMWAEPRLIKLERSLPLSFSGRQHIELIVSSLIPNKAEASELVHQAILFSELGSEIDASMRSYSRGMRSRITFSALTVGQPPLVLVDEALAVGDRQFTRKATKRIQQLSNESSTVLICDHNLNRLRRLCNRGLVIGQGTILADGSIDYAIAQHETQANKPPVKRQSYESVS